MKRKRRKLGSRIPLHPIPIWMLGSWTPRIVLPSQTAFIYTTRRRDGNKT